MRYKIYTLNSNIMLATNLNKVSREQFSHLQLAFEFELDSKPNSKKIS